MTFKLIVSGNILRETAMQHINGMFIFKYENKNKSIKSINQLNKYVQLGFFYH